MNRQQRRSMTKKLGKLIGYMANPLSDEDGKKLYFQEGTKVYIHPKRVTKGNLKRDKWVAENIGRELTIEYESKWGDRPTIYCMKEDTTDPKWLFAHHELIKVITSKNEESVKVE